MTRVDWNSFSNLADRIQVFCNDFSYRFDLSFNKPTVVNEVAQTNLLQDPNNFVETGFKLIYYGKNGRKHSVD